MVIKRFEDIAPSEIEEQVLLRRQKYSYLQTFKWITLAILVLLLFDFIANNCNYLCKVDNIFHPVKVLLFLGWLSGNFYMFYGILTDGLGKFSYSPIISRIAFIGFNVTCLGWLFGILQ